MASLPRTLAATALLALAACAPPPSPPAAPAPEPTASAPIAPVAKASPNDCGAPGSTQPCAGPQAGARAPRKVCTEMACLEGLTMTHRLAGAELAKGKHTFEIELDGAKATCSVEVKDLQGDAHADCPDRLQLSVAPRSEMRQDPPKPGAGPDAAVSASRVVVPNSTEWRIFVEGKTPKSVRVVHKLAAKTVGDHTVAPKYEKRSPNGEGCEPTCSQASETVP